VVEGVGPFGPDGRAVFTGDQLDPTFVAGAFALTTPFELSPVVTTPFGWHVIALVQRVPMSEDARRDPELGPAVVDLRARIRMQELLRARRARTAIEVSPAADDLMALGAPKP
jgi:parvulin-like peptidyl-prolyl isomerase